MTALIEAIIAALLATAAGQIITYHATGGFYGF